MGARLALPSSWQEADTRLGKRLSRKVGNNTTLYRLSGVTGDSIAISLHKTDVVTFHEDGRITLRTGGWYTVTTRSRINAALDRWGVYSVRGEWRLSPWHLSGRYYWDRAGCQQTVCTCHDDTATPYACTGCGCKPVDEPQSYVFADGCTIHPDGTVTGAAPYVPRQRRTRHATRQRRGGYSRSYFGIPAHVMNEGAESYTSSGEYLPEPAQLDVDDSGADDAKAAAIFADAGVEDADERWAEVNRKFNALLGAPKGETR